MKASIECLPCIINKISSLAIENIKNEELSIKYLKEALIEMGKSDEDMSAPEISARAMRKMAEDYDVDTDVYKKEKKYFNQMILNMENELDNRILNSEDRVLEGIKMAMAGNIIDFAAFDTIEKSTVIDILNTSVDFKVDEETLLRFYDELEKAKSLVYLVDNAGEIVFDKIFIKQLRSAYPNIDITVVTRGMPIFNDCTVKDAKFVGLDKMVTVIGNGTDIPGTELKRVDEKCKEILDSADIIISKGQGNFETLWGCDLNVYYLFLCKCDMFVKKIGKKRFECVFLSQKLIK